MSRLPAPARMGDVVSAALALLARCACCGRSVPGMEAMRYPGQVKLDYHLHPKAHLFMCIGSRSVMPWRPPRFEVAS